MMRFQIPDEFICVLLLPGTDPNLALDGEYRLDIQTCWEFELRILLFCPYHTTSHQKCEREGSSKRLFRPSPRRIRLHLRKLGVLSSGAFNCSNYE